MPIDHVIDFEVLLRIEQNIWIESYYELLISRVFTDRVL